MPGIRHLTGGGMSLFGAADGRALQAMPGLKSEYMASTAKHDTPQAESLQVC